MPFTTPTDWTTDGTTEGLSWSDVVNSQRGMWRYWDAVRRAINERRSVLGRSALPAMPQFCQTKWLHPAVVQIETNINSTLLDLGVQGQIFINHTNAVSGKFNGQATFEPWTMADLLADIGDPVKLNLTNNTMLDGTYIKQAYEIVNRLRWTFNPTASIISKDIRTASVGSWGSSSWVNTTSGFLYSTRSTSNAGRIRTELQYQYLGTTYAHSAHAYAPAQQYNLFGIGEWSDQDNGVIEDSWYEYDSAAVAAVNTRNFQFGYNDTEPPDAPINPLVARGWMCSNGSGGERTVSPGASPVMIAKWDVAGGFNFIA